MGSTSVFYGLLSNTLMGILLFVMNTFILVTKDEQMLLYGIVTLSATTVVALFAFAWKWNTVSTWSFYLVFLPLFWTSSFDVFVTFDSWRMPGGIFLKAFLEVNDPHLHNVVQTLFVILDGTIFQAVHLTVLYRLSKGLSARSLLLMAAMSLSLVLSVYTICALSSGVHLHPLTVSFLPANILYVVLLPLGVLRMPRGFTLSKKRSEGFESKALSFVTVPVLFAAGTVIAAKALVLSGIRNEYLDIVRKNDPLIFLNDVEKTIPCIAVVILYNVLVSLPLLAISFAYHFKSTKPTFLWEVAIANFSFILTSQFATIGGSFFWKTPLNLRVSPSNGTFWIINLIPLAAAAMQVASLLPYRCSLVSANMKKKTN